jgi:hypothetical protein
LARIALKELHEGLPHGVIEAYDKTTGLLKKYYKNRPKGEVDQ